MMEYLIIVIVVLVIVGIIVGNGHNRYIVKCGDDWIIRESKRMDAEKALELYHRTLHKKIWKAVWIYDAIKNESINIEELKEI